MNKTQVASYQAFKTRREYVPVALPKASMLSTVLKTRQEAAEGMTACISFIASLIIKVLFGGVYRIPWNNFFFHNPFTQVN